MCSQGDFPPYDPPEPIRPRIYRLSGDPVPRRASVALAVLGEMIDVAENAFFLTGSGLVRADILREARDRIAKAEAEYADRYGTVEP